MITFFCLINYFLYFNKSLNKKTLEFYNLYLFVLILFKNQIFFALFETQYYTLQSTETIKIILTLIK